MKVSVFGASVSAQVKNHQTGEITGYVPMLRRNHMEELGITELCQITYAGNRLSDGGLIQLCEVHRAAPDICLVEPLIEDGSRGVPATDTEIEHVYQSLLKRGILPVVVMLPNTALRPVQYPSESRRHDAIATRLGLPVIWIDLRNATDLDTKFRGIHTNAEGACIYARQIAEGLRQIGSPQEYLSRLGPPPSGPDAIIVGSVEMPDAAPNRVRRIRLELSIPHGGSARVRVLQYQAVGPFSPILMIKTRYKRTDAADSEWADTPDKNLSCWDPYCHFARKTFMPLANLDIRTNEMIELTFQCSGLDPDYAQARSTPPSWPGPDQRYIDPRGPLMWISDTRVETRLSEYE